MTHSQRLVPPQIVKFPAAKQRRLDVLLERNREGTITVREQETLAKLVAEAEQLMVRNAKRLADFSEIARVGVPSNAVPVTIWVVPETVERQNA